VMGHEKDCPALQAWDIPGACFCGGLEVGEESPLWACFDCGSLEGFTNVETHTPDMHEYDTKCNECGSFNTGDPEVDGKRFTRVHANLSVNRVRELRAEVERLRAENKRLKARGIEDMQHEIERLRKTLDAAEKVVEAARVYTSDFECDFFAAYDKLKEEK